MAIKVLANTAWERAARVLATNTSDVALADQSGVENVVGGPRYLYYTGAGTGNCRIVYVNTNGGLYADHCVIVKATNHNTHYVRLRYWTTYPASTTQLYTDDPFNEVCVGPRFEDFVYEFSPVTNVQAFGLELDSGTGGSYSKIIQQVYFSSAYTFSNIESVTRSLVPKGSRYGPRRQSYLIRESFQFVADGVTRLQLSQFEEIYKLKEEPLFLYDPQGIQIHDKLLHGFVQSYTAQAIGHDRFAVTINFAVLEYWV